MSRHVKQVTVEQLAETFAAHIRASLSPSELAQVNRRNGLPEYRGCCATHDFMDANDCMADALRDHLGSGYDLNEVLDTVNAAWDLAKARGFAAPGLEDHITEEQRT